MINSFIILGTSIKDDFVIDKWHRFKLSKEFGWTPAQIDELEEEDYQIYLVFINKLIERENREIERSKNRR